MSIVLVQQKLKAAGFDPGPLDGSWGRRTETALDLAIAQALQCKEVAEPPCRPLAWGEVVSARFREIVFSICDELGMNPDYLMSCMAWESAETFSPSITNAAGSGATGLIQFMPSTARALGTTVQDLADLSAEDQLAYVRKYFLPYKGRLQSLSDHYMAILWPSAIGKSESSVLWSKANKPTTYRQNSGLDLDRDAVITKAEAAAKVRAKLERGMQPGIRFAG